jgi:hypothetical protein
MKRSFGLLIVTLAAACSVGHAAAQDRVYNEPRWFDDRLDWCLDRATNCGKPVADAFCKRRRYTSAIDFRIAENIGRTRIMNTNETCDSPGCDGFQYIKCTGQIPADRVFANPVVGSNRLDWCLNWAADCGKPAADAFCKMKNFSRGSFAFVADAQPGGRTQVISSGRICEGPSCTGFQQIICEPNLTLRPNQSKYRQLYPHRH